MAKVLRTALLSASLLVSQFSVAPAQVNAAAPAAVEAAPPGFAPGTTTRVSVSSTQAPANGNILLSSISVDGDYVTFASSATNLVPGVNAGTFQVYLHRRSTGVTDIASVGRTTPVLPLAVGNAVSEDGNFVAFDATDPDLVDGDDNNTLYVFRRDMRTGVTHVVSANAAGEIADRGGVLPRYAGARGISSDGRYVVFSSPSTNLVPGAINNLSHVYVKDMDTGAVVRASVNTSGAPGNASTATASISGNGRLVVMTSPSTNFSPSATNGTGQIYVRDLDLGTTTLESVNNSGLPSLQFGSGAPVISSDGRYVAFETQAVLEGDDHDTFTWDVYLRDRTDHTTQLVSRSANTTTFVDSRSPAISDDGSSVAFQSADGGIVAGDSNGAGDVYLYDRATEGITLVSLNTAGQQVTSGATARSVSRDGSAVLFASASSNLVTTPASSGLQLYVREFRTNTTPIVLMDPTATATVGTELVLTGGFADPDSGQTWNASVDFGDATSAPVALAADKTFVIRHTYRAKGSYLPVVTVTDSVGASGSWTVNVSAKLRPVIFVPGLFGSELVANQSGTSVPIDNGHGVQQRIDYPGPGGNPVWLNLPQALLPGEEDYFDLLKFDTTTGIPFVTDIVPGTELLRPAGSPYFQTEEEFRSQGYVKGVDFFVFTYDWRDTMARSGDLLDVRVADIRLATGADSIDIVAHSQGGLVTRWFLLHGDERSRASRVVMLGTPNLGAPLFAYAIAGGICIPTGGPPCLISTEEVSDVLRTLPVSAFLAPSVEYYRVFPNAVSGIGDQHPAAYIDARFFSTAEEPELRGTRAQLIARQIEVGVPQSYMDVADQFHGDDSTWISQIPSSTRLTLVAGSGLPTIGQVIETWSREATVVRDVNGVIIATSVRLVQRLEARTVDGDDTVVNESASLKATAVPGTNVDVVYAHFNHGGLTEPTGLPITFALLRGEDPTVVEATREDTNRHGFHGQSSGTIISVHSPFELVVADDTGRRSGSADGQNVFDEIPRTFYQRLADAKFVTLGESPAVTATLYGTGDGGALVRVKRIEAGLVVGQSLFAHIQTRPGSRATFTVASDGSVSAMQLDVDGDGTVDQTINPTSLTPTTADDTQPPVVTIASPDARAVVGAVRLVWSATDALAGIASSVATIDGGQLEYVQGALVPVGPGTHRVDVFAEDRAANTASASETFIAHAYQWLEPIGDALVFDANEGRTIPGRFRVTTAAGAFVADASVTVVLEDSSGHVVVGPLRIASSAAEGVAIESDAYHVNVPTRGLGVGDYRIVVSFDSPTLVGRFSVPVRLR